MSNKQANYRQRTDKTYFITGVNDFAIHSTHDDCIPPVLA